MSRIPILSAKQIRALDAYTIANEPISSINLMERASRRVFNWITKHYSSDLPFIIFSGPGNNGGDGLAIARLLIKHGYKVETYLLNLFNQFSQDNLENQERLKVVKPFHEIRSEADFPELKNQVVIDALFGSGLSRALDGLSEKLVDYINLAETEVISVDIASGLFADRTCCNNTAIYPTHTLTFQYPKLAFLLPENERKTGEWHLLDIGLMDDGISTKTDYFFTTNVEELIMPVSKFSHKGTFGHALLISGSYGKMGAALLSSKACLRSGVGLLTTHVPKSGYVVMQIGLPEAMVSVDNDEMVFSTLPKLGPYKAIGIGPGLGQTKSSKIALEKLLREVNVPLVIDADGINLLSSNLELLKLAPKQTIFTPHPGEFKRLVGEWKDDFEKLELLKSFCTKHEVVVVLKGAYTAVCNSNGQVYFNSTGNPAMATAGSGDVLTGIVLAYLARGMEPITASIKAVFDHGSAGDRVVKKNRSLIASDLISEL